MASEKLRRYIVTIPKAELHVHVEGTLEPELMFEIAKRNNIAVEGTVQSHKGRRANFKNLQDFLDIYYEACSVLRTERDFYDLMLCYLKRAAADNVLYAEVFFDPQTHTQRGVPFDTVITGLYNATVDGQDLFGIKGRIIISFLRHLSEEEALKALEEAKPYLDKIIAIDLDSGEVGNPPQKFSRLFKQAAELGLKLTAHSGEEGGPEYIHDALDQKVVRINHGVRCYGDEDVIRRLKGDGIPLTMCPLSNLKLQVCSHFLKGNLYIKELLDQGLKVTINSDDPAYFGGYMNDNFFFADQVDGLSQEDVYKICCNAFDATFLPPQDKIQYKRLLYRHRWEMGYAPTPKNVVVFGSELAQPGSKEYQFAYEVSQLFAKEGFTVINGGYDGIMRAASQGGFDGNGMVEGVVAPTVFLQHDHFGNEFLTHHRIAHSLPERLTQLVLHSNIFVVCPGTIGTLLELAMAWNLSSDKSSSDAVSPHVFLMREPWEAVIRSLHSSLQILHADIKLLTFVDSPGEVLAEVKRTMCF